MNHKRAFTLIEVLVVIAILAVVAGIVMAVTMRVRAKGWQTTCASNLRQLGAASLMYAHDYDGYLPPYLNEVFGPDCTDRVRCAAAALHTVLSAYVHDNSVWFCPTDPVAGQDVTRWGRSHRYSSYVFCTTKDLSVRDDGHRLPWGAVENPAEYPFVHDSNKSHLSRPDAPDYNPTSGCEHFGGINVWYLDGHLKWVPPWSE